VPTEPTIRGYMLMSPLTYIQEAYAELDRQAILARLPDETRDVIRTLKDVEWYPRRHSVNIYTATANHHRERDGKVREALFNLGASTASRAIETFLRLVMKVMTPEVFARKVPDNWLRDHRGGRLEVDMDDVGNNHLVYRLIDVEGYDYIGGAFPGFQTAALSAIGCTDLTHESDWSPEVAGPPTVTCHLRWK
jgi:hypothetical protein